MLTFLLAIFAISCEMSVTDQLFKIYVTLDKFNNISKILGSILSINLRNLLKTGLNGLLIKFINFGWVNAQGFK